MITCAECGKALDKVPEWYSTVNIRFVCDECRKVNPQHWLPASLDEDEEKLLARDEDAAFVEGEVSLEELEKRDRKRLVGEGDDLFDADLLEEEPEEE